MPIELRTYASGDTDYISKLNQNVAILEEVIGQLQAQIGAINTGTNALSVGTFLDTLFNHADALVGMGSYLPTPSATTLSIAPGGAYLAEGQEVVSSYIPTPLSFLGKIPGTYYVVATANSGFPALSDTLAPGALYSIYWTGTAFGVDPPFRLVPAFYDTLESDASRKSAHLAQEFSSLDQRLEAEEAWTLAEIPVRKVGITVDGSTGIKGAIQVDFAGTIIGWSVMADSVGTLQVEVEKKASSPPPAAPAIPNTTTDKISASAPISLSSAQSASSGAAGVSTWTTHVNQWDVIQFNVAAVTTISRATLYLRIQEFIPSPP